MNLVKQSEFFNPLSIEETIHVIGIGAIGSNVAEQLTRMGIPEITLWDFDTVDAHNIANQMYNATDIGNLKTAALASHLQAINPDIQIKTKERWDPDCNTTGYIFLCVDSICIRQQLVDKCKNNLRVKGIFDFRMRLTDAQHYAARPNNEIEMRNLWASMDFTQDEADEATPVSACGTSLSILPTIRMITALGVANFVNVVRTGALQTTILIDAFEPFMQSFAKH